MLEIVITGRNDEFGGADFAERLCSAAAYNHALFSEAQIPHCYTMVEWNPLEGRPLLSEIVKRRLPWFDQFWIVDPLWHRRLSTNPHLSFMEFFAKNVAIRRSSASVILATNTDVFLSESVIDYLRATPSLQPRTVYRAVRIDIDRNADWRSPSEALFSNVSNTVRVNSFTDDQLSNASGDFLLLRRDAWQEMRGFNETVRYAKIHKDGQFCYKALLEGYRFVSIGRIWHIDHSTSYGNVKYHLADPAKAPYGPEWDYRTNYHNPDHWGISGGIEERSSSGAVWLRHPESHGPELSIVIVRRGRAGPPETRLAGEGLEVVTVPGSNSIVAGVNAGLAAAHGRYLLVTGDQDFPRGDAFEHARFLLKSRKADLWIGAEDAIQHSTLGIVPSAESSFIFSRDAYESAGEWDETQPNASLDFWLRAAQGRKISTFEGSLGRLLRRWIPLGHRLEARALLCRSAAESAAALSNTIQEASAVVQSLRDSLRLWVRECLAGSPSGQGTRCGIWGISFATPFLRQALTQETGRSVVILTADLSQAETVQWGGTVRHVGSLTPLGITDLFAVGAGDRDLEIIRAGGYSGRIHLLGGALGSLRSGGLPSELDLAHDNFIREVRSGNCEEALSRLPLLSTLDRSHQPARFYQLAQCLEGKGRVREALRYFRLATCRTPGDPRLRMRAAYHCGRILYETGRWRRALRILLQVLQQVPDHGKAREHVADILRRAEAPDSLLRSAISLGVDPGAG